LDVLDESESGDDEDAREEEERVGEAKFFAMSQVRPRGGNATSSNGVLSTNGGLMSIKMTGLGAF
jgi:hypothetical protein